jgi:cytochrome c oxidase cbb3-type subunit 2
MINPRSVVPESIMPGYPYLAERALDYDDIQDQLKANAVVGVPYTEEMIESAKADLEAQAGKDSGDAEALLGRYPKAQTGSFDGNPEQITELDALIAYLQMLGTLVDFANFDEAGPNLR